MRLIYITKNLFVALAILLCTTNVLLSQKKDQVSNCETTIHLTKEQSNDVLDSVVRAHGSQKNTVNEGKLSVKKMRIGNSIATTDLTISIEQNFLIYKFESLDKKTKIQADLIFNELANIKLHGVVDLKKSTCTSYTVKINLGISDVEEVYNSLLSNTHDEILTAEVSKAFISELESTFNITSVLDDKSQLKGEILAKRRIGSPNAQVNISISGKSNVLSIKFSPLHGQNSVSKEIIEKELKKIYPNSQLDLKLNQYSEFTITFDLVLEDYIKEVHTEICKKVDTRYLTKTQTESLIDRLIAYYSIDLNQIEGIGTILSNFRIGSPTAGAIMNISVKDRIIKFEFTGLPNNNVLDKGVVEQELQKLIRGYELPNQFQSCSKFTLTVDLFLEFSKTDYANKLIKETKPNRWTYGISASGSYVYRNLSANSLEIDLSTQIETRDRNEYAFVAPQLTFSVGRSSRSHRTSIGLSWLRLGYLFDDSSYVDLSTGSYSIDEKIDKQVDNFFAFSLNYQYISYYRKIAPYFMAGINITYGFKNNVVSTSPNNYFGTSLKSAFGLTYNPCYHWSFHFSPTGLVFLDSRKYEQINARFYTIGFEVGAVYNFGVFEKSKN